MLLREFTLEEDTINLIEESNIYIVQIFNPSGEKLYYQEFEDYDKVKIIFNEIIQKCENGGCTVDTAIQLLKENNC